MQVAHFREPVFLYGAGIHTAQLLDRTGLAPHIIAIADRDTKKWGQTQAGKPVISPAELFADPRQAPVIISSYVSERQIVEALLAGGVARQRIVPLYSDMPDRTKSVRASAG
jgi:FlaA1/EpsC-like NDP-sugar epimerase